jgi:DNA gyrase subunit B
MSDDNNKPGPEEYGADSIKVLKGLEAVRKRPGMYIGDTDDGSGLHHMVYEVVDNGIDEALAGHCDASRCTLHPDDSRARYQTMAAAYLPTCTEEGVSAAEVIMTQLHAGGKVRPELLQGFRRPARCGCVGCQRAVDLARNWTSGATARNTGTSSNHGDGGWHLEPVGDAGRQEGNGNHAFCRARRPSQTSSSTSRRIEHRLRELAFLNSGVFIIVADDRGAEPKSVELHYEGGISGVREISRPLQDADAAGTRSITTEKDGVTVKCALWWNDSYHENVLCFTNNIPQRDGGTHLAGFRGALTRTINHYANEPASRRKRRSRFTAMTPARG